MPNHDDDEKARRCYEAAAEVLVSLHEEFNPIDAAAVLLCALGRLAAFQRVPEPQAWRTVISDGCHAGFKFGYLNQTEQFSEAENHSQVRVDLCAACAAKLRKIREEQGEDAMVQATLPMLEACTICSAQMPKRVGQKLVRKDHN